MEINGILIMSTAIVLWAAFTLGRYVEYRKYVEIGLVEYKTKIAKIYIRKNLK